MRTLFEIIESAKDGKIPTHEECYYAMLVYNYMFNLEHIQLRKILTSEKDLFPVIKRMKLENSFKMYNTALNKSPKEYLGSNDPQNEEYQKMRRAGNNLFNKILTDTILTNKDE